MELNYALIGTRIKKIRKSQKFTQERLSEMAEGTVFCFEI